MSVPSQQTPAPKSGLAWLTLIVSVLALVGLCVWALLNQHLLLKQNSEATQPAASNQPVSGLQQSDNSGVDRENEQPRLATNVASNVASTVASTVASNVPSSVSSGLSTGLSSGVSANPPTRQESGSPASQDGQNLAATEDNAVVEETAESAQIENAEDKALAQEQAAKKASDEAAAEARAAKVRAAEREAAEKLAAEQEAAIKPAAEETTAEEAVAEKLDLEQQQVERLAALPETAIPSADNDDAATPVAPETETAFETSRREDLAKLPELATQIRFATNDTETIGDSKQPLDRMFELLFLYSETTVTVEVATNEYEIDDSNQLISRLRALVIVNYLIERGLDAGRFRIRANGQQGIPADSHQVSVVATVVDK